MAKKQKKRWGDRRDGALIRKIDSMHFITPLIHPNRCDNEVFNTERIEMEPIMAYINRKNAEHPETSITYFHVFIAAFLKTIVLRPQLNRFIVNHRVYQRNYISASFTVKKEFRLYGYLTTSLIRVSSHVRVSATRSIPSCIPYLTRSPLIPHLKFFLMKRAGKI